MALTNPKVSTTPSSNGFMFTRGASLNCIDIEAR